MNQLVAHVCPSAVHVLQQVSLAPKDFFLLEITAQPSDRATPQGYGINFQLQYRYHNLPAGNMKVGSTARFSIKWECTDVQ